jgi:hypothetical protein
MTQDHYFGRRVAKTGAAMALAALDRHRRDTKSEGKVVAILEDQVATRLTCADVGPVGIEPTTRGLKIGCSRRCS